MKIITIDQFLENISYYFDFVKQDYANEVIIILEDGKSVSLTQHIFF